MQINNYIFDLDGTIINSSNEVLLCFEKAFAQSNYQIDKTRLTPNVIGPPLKEIIKLIAPEIEENDIEIVMENFRQIYDYDEHDISEYYSGILEFLNQAKKVGKRLFIATYKPEKPTRRIEKQFKMDMFEDIYTIDKFGKHITKAEMIEDILNKKNKQKEADIHAYLVYTIRKRHNWNIDENLEYKIEKAGFDLDNEDYFTIEKHLHHLWEEYLYKNQELKKGVIVSVLPNKKAGFIRCNEYPDNLYFSMNEFKHNITLAKTDQNVTFYEADSFDKKKNKQVKNAVNIYLNGG